MLHNLYKINTSFSFEGVWHSARGREPGAVQGEGGEGGGGEGEEAEGDRGAEGQGKWQKGPNLHIVFHLHTSEQFQLAVEVITI